MADKKFSESDEKTSANPNDSTLGGLQGDPLIKPNRPSFGSRIRANFLAGVVITAPIGITAAIIWWFINGPLRRLDTFVKNWLPDGGSNVEKVLQAIPLFGVVVAVLGLIFLGALTRNFIGGAIIKFWENIVDSVPVVRNLYRFFKNVFETALQQSDRSFKEVALVEYPRPGLWAMSFVVGSARGEVKEKLNGEGNDLVSIFVPTVPNPTSGFLIFVPRSNLHILSMSVEEAAKVVFSMGLVVPDSANPEEAVRKLEDLAEKISDTPETEKGGRKRFLSGNRKAG